MRILVIGADGMLGHRLVRDLSPRHEVCGTLRLSASAATAPAGTRLIGGVDVRDAASVKGALRAFQPEVVVNAAGIVKQRGEAHEAIQSIEVNALFPHRLAEVCREMRSYLVHF